MARALVLLLLLLAPPAHAAENAGALSPEIAAPFIGRPEGGGAQVAPDDGPEKAESYTGYVRLKDYVDLRFDELRRELILRFQASELAIEKAETATAIHFATINGLNDRLEEQAKDMVTKDAFDSSMAGSAVERNILSDRIKALELKSERQEGAASVGTVLWGMGATLALAILAALALRFMGPRSEVVAARK